MPDIQSDQPSLLALLICDQALLDEGKVPTLVRLIDTFNVGLEVSAEQQISPERLGVELRCMVFTKWGPGGGEFVEELRLVDSKGEEYSLGEPLSFTKPDGFHFQTIRHGIRLGVSSPGSYSFRVYLNGQLRGEHPFRVNIEKKIISTEESKSVQPP